VKCIFQRFLKSAKFIYNAQTGNVLLVDVPSVVHELQLNKT